MMNALFLLATDVKPGDLPRGDLDTAAVTTIIGIVFGFIGAIALFVIVLSGMRYITSAGDSQKASQAKNGIIYALVGIAVALVAEAIVVVAAKLGV